MFDSKGRNLNRLSKIIALFFFSLESFKIRDCFFHLFEIYTVLLHENVLTECLETKALIQFVEQSLNSVARLVNFFFCMRFRASEM